MAYHVDLEFAAKTDIGLLRTHNEDSVTADPGHGFGILADGMGGYNAGEVASSMATAIAAQTLQDQLQGFDWQVPSQRARLVKELMVDAVIRANAAIFAAAQADPQYSGMGTTVVAALFHHNKVAVAHVGDSRLYRLRSHNLVPMTRDHSLLQEQIDAGLIDAAQARFSPHKNLITRAVGIDQELNVEFHEHVTMAGDIYLFCSDGLSDMLSTQEIVDILERFSSSLDTACEALIQKANDNGGYDNISIILAKIHSTDTDAEGRLDRIKNWFR